MAVLNEVPLSRVQEFGRTDAEYFKPTYEASFRRVSFCQGEKIARLANITDGIHASPEITENGIRYISAKCVKDNEFVIDGCINISQKQHEANPRTQLREGDVIITTVGTIGNVAVVDEDITPCNCDRHVGIIRIKEPNDFSPFYLSTFLNSKYGQFQSLRESAGNVQLNLYIKNIGHIVVPRFGDAELEIAELTRTAYLMRRKSKAIYTQARKFLEAELGLDKLRFDKPVGYTARFSELESSRRSDAEFFCPEYQVIVNLVRKHSPIPMGRLFSVKRGVCLDPRIYSETNGLPYIRIKELSLTQPLSKEHSVKIPDEYLPTCCPRAITGNFVMAVIGATIGKINLIDHDMSGSLFSNNTACLTPKFDIKHPNAFELILRSQVVQRQVQQRMAKTAQEKISDPELKRILIPSLAPDLLDELEKLSLSSKKNYFQSKLLLDQAKSRVEQLIEEAVQS
jgi:hypothetical protein